MGKFKKRSKGQTRESPIIVLHSGSIKKVETRTNLKIERDRKVLQMRKNIIN